MSVQQLSAEEAEQLARDARDHFERLDAALSFDGSVTSQEWQDARDMAEFQERQARGIRAQQERSEDALREKAVAKLRAKQRKTFARTSADLVWALDTLKQDIAALASVVARHNEESVAGLAGLVALCPPNASLDDDSQLPDWFTEARRAISRDTREHVAAFLVAGTVLEALDECKEAGHRTLDVEAERLLYPYRENVRALRDAASKDRS